MVSSTTRKIFSLAISLLVVVISLTGVALGATAPTGLSKLARYTPGFSGAPGKMARDAAGNFYVTDFWGKGIRKFDRTLADPNPTFIATNGRPSAVAVLPDNTLVVAMVAPQAYVAFYSQVTGKELSKFVNPAQPYYRPVAITVDAAGNIYVLDSGDSTGEKADNCPVTYLTPGTANYGKVRVYNAAGTTELYSFGSRTATNCTSVTGGEFKQPLGIAYEKVGNQIVVVDTLNCRLQFFTALTGGVCTYVAGKDIGSSNSSIETYSPTGALKLGNAVDVAFEYNAAGTVLNRIYVAERGRNEIVVVDPVSKNALARLNGTTVTNASMKFPSAVLFEKTATGGVLYTNNAATSTAADILAIAIDSGTIPAPGFTFSVATAIPSTTSSPTITLSGAVSVSGNQVSCNVNGGALTNVSASGNAWSGLTLNLASGVTNYILCKSSDATTTKYVEASTFRTGGGTAPTVTIVQPAAGVYTNNSTVLVSGTSDTAGAAVKIDNPLASFTAYTQTDASKNWSAVINLAEGSNAISVTIWAPGTATGTSSRTVIADYTAPNLVNMVSFLSNGATTNTAVQNLDGIVYEKNLSTIEVNGALVTAKVTMPSDNTYFSVPVTLLRGSNTITVKATDLAGNVSSTITRTAILDLEIPAFTAALPGDNSFMTGGSSTPANGLIDTSFASATACGSPVTPGSGAWSGSCAVGAGYGPGINAYPFTASGIFNTVPKTIEVKRSIINGAAYAKLAITSPAADIATKNSSVLVAGSVAIGAAQPTISVDGGTAVLVSSYNAGTGAFSHTVTLSIEGVHYVKVTADAATTAIRNIIYDTTPPEMQIQSNANAMPSQVTGSIEPSSNISLIDATLNGVPYTIPTDKVTYSAYDPATLSVLWTADLIAYNYDEGSLAFTAVDPASNTTKLFYVKGMPTGDTYVDDGKTGLIDINDALYCLRHVVGTTTLLGNRRFHGDVGSQVGGHAAQDGAINIVDCTLILGKITGLLSF